MYCIKWNEKGDYLLTGRKDEDAIVWVKKDYGSQQFKFRSGCIFISFYLSSVELRNWPWLACNLMYIGLILDVDW